MNKWPGFLAETLLMLASSRSRQHNSGIIYIQKGHLSPNLPLERGFLFVVERTFLLFSENPLTNRPGCDILYVKDDGGVYHRHVRFIPLHLRISNFGILKKGIKTMQVPAKNRSPTYQKISLTKTQQSFFRATDAVASLSNHNQAKLGCVLVDKHRIVSSGHNSSTRCSPLQKQMDTARFGFPDKHRGPVHAETACLLPLIRQGYDMSRSDLYIVRRHKNGSLALSRPCPGCMSLLRANGVRRVFFSVEGGFAVERVG